MSDSKNRVATPAVVDEPVEAQTSANTDRSAALGHGRRVLIRNGAEAQTIEVRGPDGGLEVQIVLTEQGPVVRLTAGRMEIATTEDVDVRCRNFRVHAEEGVEIETEGKMALRSEDDLDLEAKQGDLRAKGETIWLN